MDLEVKQVDRIIVLLSMMISIPIVICNLLCCSPSTYVGWTQANFFSWFTNGYELYHPRELATIFFFSEGNTTGIVLFMTLPLMWNILRKNFDWKLIVCIFIQGIAMCCISTRVATYGVLIMSGAYLVIYIFCLLFKKYKFDYRFVIVLIAFLALFGSVFTKTPAYVNQQLNEHNDALIVDNEELRKELKNSYTDPKLEPFSEEYINYWSHVFADNTFFLSFPETYYTKLYFYRFDPKWWVDIIFEVDFYDRASGRDIERIFTRYKWDNLTNVQKLFGVTAICKNVGYPWPFGYIQIPINRPPRFSVICSL